VLLAQGSSIAQVCKQLGIADQTFYHWRKNFRGMKVDQARRLKELETENARLKRSVADLLQHAPAAQFARIPAAGFRNTTTHRGTSTTANSYVN
jgi:transposase-like protein